MAETLLIWRLFGVAIIVWFVSRLLMTRDKPPEWVYQRWGMPFPMRRDIYRFWVIASIITGFAILAWWFVVPS